MSTTSTKKKHGRGRLTKKRSLNKSSAEVVNLSSTTTPVETKTTTTDSGPRTESNKDSATIAYSVSRLSGGFLNKYPIIFTQDAKCFFCCVFNTIKVYSVATGESIKTLSISPQKAGHIDEITSLILNPKNPSQLYSGSLDGTIKLWDYKESTLLETFHLYVPIYRMVMHPLYPETIYVVTDISSVDVTKVNFENEAEVDEDISNGNNFLLLRIKLLSDGKSKLVKVDSAKFPCAGIDISSDGKYMVIAFHKIFHVINLQIARKEIRLWPSYYSLREISALAIHPTRSCVAIGDSFGKITYWYCLKEGRDTNPVTSTVHWHAHKVNHLTFTNDGTYLLSGGEEATLVIWQVETGQRRYVPRVGSEILTITVSPDQGLYALGLSDNSIKVISAINLEIRQVTQGLRYIWKYQKTCPLYTGLVIEPQNRHVVLNGLPGTLQWYNAYESRHILELEVTRRTLVSRTDEKEIVNSEVKHVAFSSDGSWMATVDSRDDGETTPELYLKFWEFIPEEQTYSLNTIVDKPHSQPITCLAFHPSAKNGELIVVSTGLDKKFRTWRLETTVDKKGKQDRVWNCASIGSYRDEIPYKAAFSEDGSVLAIAFGSFLTLWDPILNEFHGVLTHTPYDQDVTNILFLSSFLVTTTQDHLNVWDLISFSLSWSCKIEIQYLASDQKACRFAVASNVERNSECRVLVFNPKSPSPQAVHIIDSQVKGITYLPRNTDSVETQSSILYMSDNFDLHVVGQPIMITDEKDSNSNLITLKGDSKSFFTDIFGANQLADSAQISDSIDSLPIPAKLIQNAKNAVKSVFSAPSHVIPPVGSIISVFMDALFVKATPPESSATPLESSNQKQRAREKEKEESDGVGIKNYNEKTIKIIAPMEMDDCLYQDHKDDEKEFSFMTDFFYARLKKDSLAHKHQETPSSKIIIPPSSMLPTEKIKNIVSNGKKRKKSQFDDKLAADDTLQTKTKKTRKIKK